MVPEFIKKRDISWGPFLDPVFERVGALLVPLGSLLGPSQAVLEGLGPPKHYKLKVF